MKYCYRIHKLCCKTYKEIFDKNGVDMIAICLIENPGSDYDELKKKVKDMNKEYIQGDILDQIPCSVEITSTRQSVLKKDWNTIVHLIHDIQ